MAPAPSATRLTSLEAGDVALDELHPECSQRGDFAAGPDQRAHPNAFFPKLLANVGTDQTRGPGDGNCVDTIQLAHFDSLRFPVARTAALCAAASTSARR